MFVEIVNTLLTSQLMVEKAKLKGLEAWSTPESHVLSASIQYGIIELERQIEMIEKNGK